MKIVCNSLIFLLVLSGLACAEVGKAPSHTQEAHNKNTGTPRYGIFVYSNFCTSPMSGDLYGNRITLRRLIDGDMLIYEYTDGGTHIVVADNLKVDSKSGIVSFVHADENLDTKVSGQISNDGGSLKVRGMLFDEQATVTLKLISDFSKPIKNCVE